MMVPNKKRYSLDLCFGNPSAGKKLLNQRDTLFLLILTVCVSVFFAA